MEFMGHEEGGGGMEWRGILKLMYGGKVNPLLIFFREIPNIYLI